MQKETFDIERFYEAHKRDYSRALSEVKSGEKRSHWMWYIFPQLEGLGYSPMASYYGITCVAEAKAYLEDEYLGSCLKEICQALLDLDTNDAKSVFGDIDAMKLKSSMTLFEAATSDEPLFANVLDEFFDGTRDERTLELISR